MRDRAYYSNAFQMHMQALEDAVARNDEESTWRETHDVLAWLYNLEEWSRLNDLGYYDHRNASENGRTAAGLIWLRGELQHHQMDVRTLAWKPTRPYVKRSDEWVEATTHVRRDGGWVPDRVSVALLVWPARANLPPPTQVEKRHRDEYYDRLVAGQPLLNPLRTALSYFMEERTP